MADLKNDIPGSRPVPDDDQGQRAVAEDEINLVDYFRVLLKRKRLIILGSVLPALLVGLIFFFWPGKYKVTYSYDITKLSTYGVETWDLDEKNYTMLLTRFYSDGNIEKVADKLRANGLSRYAELIGRAKSQKDLTKFVYFKVLPPYMGASRAKITNPIELEKISRLKALLLNLIIVARSEDEISKISLVVKDNFENVIPVYLLDEQLSAAVRQCRTSLIGIEENRFQLGLDLGTSKSILAKLKNIKAEASDKAESNITLQFDVSDRSGSRYLPLSYQIEATESKVAELEEEIEANKTKYDYYKALLAVNQKLSVELNDNKSSYYTIQQFHSFLTKLIADYNDDKIKDYLNSYIKKIENRISASVPIVEKPKVYLIPKGTARKSAIALGIFLMISIFAAFLSEGIQKSQV